jgi:hypothetical protein
MANILKDAVGVFNLDAVVAVTPRKAPKDGKDLATLHFVGGANIDTATTFEDASAAFGVKPTASSGK